MAKVNKTKYALLGVLNIISGSGYDIKKFCDHSIGFFWNENYGHIYPVLQKLEEDELVTKRVEQTEGKPSRNVYSITEKGRNELEEWLKLPPENQPVRSELLLKLFLSRNLPTEDIIRNMEEIKEASLKELAQYDVIEGLIMSRKDKVDEKTFTLWKITLRNGRIGEEARLKWCEETLQSLRELNK
ncbi:PadR family transcriptional regulator [Clostridium manihotivorum]|uniref:PadR family transcriptional regulator n=1 Tax=Clostridium manihotivorum TaxID=2320868 RepID=A0A410DWI9_9CLOT|nr:PadR family transcriptional regulator [Clostridium manihotivorum]QAA33427.1 PadR family transcriptional regulator [Clostridium manihotivorum]